MTTQLNPQSKALAELLASIEPIPGFDCLEMKRLGQELILKELEGLSPEEVRAYWAQRHAELIALQAEMRQKLAE